MLGITKLESVSLKGFFLISVLLKVSYMEDVTSNPTVPDSTTSSTSLSRSVPQSDVGAGPVVVGNLSVTQVTTSSVSLRWSPPPGNITSYLAEWKEGTTCKNKSTEAPSINITDLTPGTQYKFTVIPIFGDNLKSDPVNCSQFTRPNPPGDIKIVEKTNDSISLSWDVPVMGAAAEANYSVACTSRLNPSTQTMLVSQNQVKFSGLTSGTLYYISVGTVGPQDLRSRNVSRNEYTLPNPVQNLKASMKSISSVTLEWESPVGAQSYFEYRVNISSNGSVRSQTTSMNQSNITDLNPGTKYNCSVTTLASNDTYGPPLFTFCQTKPMPVYNLSDIAVNTTAVSLMWSSSDYEENTYYLIFNPRDQTMIQNTTNKSISISDLTPGTSYTIGVKAVVNGVVSDPTTISILTKPEKAKNVTVIGTTTSLTVTWDRPEGNVTSYIIDIYNGSSRAASQTVFNNSAVFANLKPGRLYSVTLATLSGPLQGEPQMINCSTYPSPPSFIKVEGATTSSINISWGRPSDMDGDQYAYIVSYQGNEINSTDTCFMLGNLTSGTPYNISVLTVGPMSYKSTPQTVLSCTRVSSVKNLQAAEITTSNVTLVWQSPNSGKSYEYFVTAKSPTQVTNFTVNRTDASIRSLQSGSNYTFDVTVMLQGVCESAAESISLFTRPYPIADLKSEAINESVVYLNWTRPQEYQDSYTYTVQISGCTSNTKNQSVQQEQAYIYDLIPGTNCSLLIYSRASNGIEGWPLSTSQYTKLEKVMPAVSNGYKNDSINVTWDPPRGNIEKYVVTLYNPQEQNSTQELNNTARSCLFVNLKAGRMYTVRVRTRSGPFAEESQEVSVATYPNKPGDITIADKNTSSIALAWSSPLDSDGSTNYYVVKYQSALYNHTIKTNTSSSVLNGLASGTSYNISVATVGPKELESAPVTVDLVTTRPEKVQSLEIQSVSHEKVVLKWSAPPDFKNGYYYGVTTSRTDYVINTTLNETYQVVDLLPGTEYHFSVMTLALDGTESSHAVVSSCTDAAPVRNIRCQGPDLTLALLEVQWSSPKGLNKGFEINITDKPKETLSNCTSKCTHILKNLSYNTNYTVNILTRGCGNSSPITAVSCKTGITVPLIPDIKDYIQVTDVEHDRFTLDLDPGLFSDSEGPIVSYGILVTSSESSIIGGNSSSLKKYLKTTYEAWNTGNGAAYLATLKGDKEKYQGGKTSIVIGDNTEWGRYINGPLKSKGSYTFAIVMFTRLEKNGEFIDTSKSYVSISPFYDTEINLPENPVVVASIVISIVSILLLISIFIIGAVSLKRRKRPEPSEVPILSMREKASVPIKVEDFKDYFRKQQANSNCGFAKEFENLKSVGVSQAKSSALTLENKGKNRYNNVLPYDSSRVKLSIQGSPFDDYINANYIPGYNSRKEFIAAQGPLASTVNEFWRMIWEKNVNTLVMLTRCTEQGRVKCEEYWPSGTKHFSNITVTSTSEIVLDDWTIRDFTVKNVKTAEKRPLRQFHFTAWPDHGVPGTTELLITFRHLVREHMDQFSRHSPSVVHCSAGVGRTGTFIAIDRLIFQIERDNEVDVHGIVHDLRMHRPLMVQTEDQYVFLNQCAMDFVRSRNGTNVDLIYENTAAISIYENFQPMKKSKNGYRHT